MDFQASESLSLQIAQHLGQQIIMGDLVEGERIQELRIAKELNVSRGSVREALLILERRHLIAIYPRRGAVVAEVTAQNVKSLYEILGLLLQTVVRKTADNWRQQEIEFFHEQLHILQGHMDDHDVEAFYEAIFSMFRSACRYVHNGYIDEVLADLFPAVKRSYFLALHADRRELEEAFSLIKGVVDGLLTRKGEQAASLVDEFCMHQCNLVLDSLMRVKQIELAWARRSRR